MAGEDRSRTDPIQLLIVFLFLSLGISMAGISYNQSQWQLLKEETQKGLIAVTELKTKQIVEWRQDRLNDAAFLTENPLLAEQTEKSIANPLDFKIKQTIQDYLISHSKNFKYRGIHLLDKNLQILVDTSDFSDTPDPQKLVIASKALQERRVVFSDIYTADSRLNISLAAPIFKKSEERTDLVGVVVLL